MRGIINRLGHVRSLGVDALWLSPIFASPMVDGGYDVQDYRKINPRFGSEQDFDDLVTAVHECGLLLMLDQVLNHTSDRHAWFQASIAGNADHAEMYVWRDPKPDGTAPNNWLTQFGQPAWRWNHKRRQYYLHQFLKEQPSLNLRSERVQNEHANMLQFWRDRGVDGFRFDAVTSFLFDPSMKDNPAATREVQDKVSGENFVPYTYQDHVYDILPGDGAAYMEKLRRWSGEACFIIGESTSGNQSIELARKFSGPKRLDGCYTTDLTEGDLTAQTLVDVLDRLDGSAATPWWLGSHDQPRQVSRSGDGSISDAKMMAMVMAFFPGTWLLFQGEELALPQPNLNEDETIDPLDLLYWPDGPGRDGARVPIPWTDTPDGFGFSDSKPWLPMRWEAGASVQTQQDDSDSCLSFYRTVIELRKKLKLGNARLLRYAAKGDIFVAEAEIDAETYGMVVNFGTIDQPHSMSMSRVEGLLSSGGDKDLCSARCAHWFRMTA